MKEYLKTPEEVLKELNTSQTQGLSPSEAKARLEEHGLNKLDEPERDSLFKRFMTQLADPMIIMLIVAAVISAAISMAQGSGDFADVIIILFVVAVNAILGVVQESKAEEALKSLQEMSAAQAKVIRDGQQMQVPTAELVPGDIVVLEAGDSVPADCRVLESATMKIEESALTGESVPIEKFSHKLEAGPEGQVTLGDRKNMCYSGSVVVYGRGVAVVVRTGMDTEMGKIATAISQAEEEQTPLQLKLNELSHILTRIVIGICLVIFATGFFKHGSGFFSSPQLMINGFMVAVSLAVAAIPEGLAAVVTIVLSIGVTKMSKHHAIVRRLTAVETLGCTQLICSDKTGTLTQNKMTVVQHATENKTALLRAMALSSDAKFVDGTGEIQGEPTEAALCADAAKEGMTSSKLDGQFPRIGEAPFDSVRKMMSVVVETPDHGYMQYTKGAPDEVLKRCTKRLDHDGNVVELTDEWRQKILADNKDMADRALRVLAGAQRDYGDRKPGSFKAEDLEQDLTFIGLSGMIDPVRPEVKDAIVEAHDAGIRVVMITGDHIDTAVAIARDLDVISQRSQAITGAELDKLSDEEFFDKVQDFNVYARVQPEHKVRIVETWKKRGKVVAMTGDGVNDAPSIKRADIGIGMGITGTDVTKDVADMVLADDNFATIVDAVDEGRRIYDNIRKAIQFLLSSNLAEVISVFAASMIGFTILEPTHLLWINLITDCFPALAMGMEPAEPGIMQRPPRDSKDGIFAGGMGVDTAFQGVIIALLTLVSYFVGHYLEYGTWSVANVIADPQLGREGMTMAFLTLSMVEMFHSFNMRSRRKSIFGLHTHNKWLWISFAGSLVLTYMVIEIPALSQAFGFVNLDATAYLIALCLAALVIPIVELYKAVMRKLDSKEA